MYTATTLKQSFETNVPKKVQVFAKVVTFLVETQTNPELTLVPKALLRASIIYIAI